MWSYYYFLILELHNAEPWPSLGSNGGSCLKGSGIGVANLGINCWSHRQRGGFRTKLGTDEENRCHRIIVIAQGGLHLRTYLCAGLGNLWFPTGCGKGLCTSRGICANPWRLQCKQHWDAGKNHPHWGHTMQRSRDLNGFMRKFSIGLRNFQPIITWWKFTRTTAELHHILQYHCSYYCSCSELHAFPIFVCKIIQGLDVSFFTALVAEIPPVRRPPTATSPKRALAPRPNDAWQHGQALISEQRMENEMVISNTNNCQFFSQEEHFCTLTGQYTVVGGLSKRNALLHVHDHEWSCSKSYSGESECYFYIQWPSYKYCIV